jgi:putative lipoic acid-binding regulatory protein
MTKNAIEFPCQFPIKIMGLADMEFEGIVVAILNEHVPDLGEGAIMLKLSAGGKYISMTATIRARSQEQLDNLYRALSGHPKVLMVL